MGKRKFIIGGIIICIAIASLSFMAFRGAATYYYTVNEAIEKQNDLIGQNIRVAGQVAPGSVIHVNPEVNNVSFIIQDTTDSGKRLVVRYKGALPDAFKEGNDAVVEGRLFSASSFDAQQIIVKCPSKYEPKQ